MAADFLQTVLGELSGQIHTNLSRLSYALAAFLALQVRKADIEMPGHDIGNIADSYMPCGHVNLALHRRLGYFKGNFFARRHRHGVYGRQCPFKLPDICVDLAGDVAGDLLADVQSAKVRLFLDYCNAGLVARRVNSGDEAPVEPAYKPFFKRWYFAWRAVGAENYLFAVAIKRVERVEKLFLALLAFAEELDIVDYNGIDRAKSALKAGQVALLDCLDEAIDELLAA